MLVPLGLSLWWTLKQVLQYRAANEVMRMSFKLQMILERQRLAEIMLRTQESQRLLIMYQNKKRTEKNQYLNQMRKAKRNSLKARFTDSSLPSAGDVA
jgi:hypothetical protein